MSIPDNPFDRDQTSPSPSPRHVIPLSPPTRPLSPPHRSTSPPILNISTHQPAISQAADAMPMTGSTSFTPGSLAVPQTGGTKTPRRVQWNNDSHIVTISPAPLDPPQSPSNTIDENNIDRVHAALERHKSGRQPRPMSTVSTASSAPSTSTDDDYDYRLDTDPPLEPITSHESRFGRDDDDNLHQILDNGVNDAVPEYINFGETDGLPNITNAQRKQDDGMNEAAGLVRAHTGRWGGLRRRVKGASAVSSAFGRRGSRAQQAEDPEKESHARQSREHDDFASRYPEDGGPSRHAPPVATGASVLSSLLALYGQQQGMESGATSAATSRTNSDDDDSSSDDDEAMAGARIREAAAQQAAQQQANANSFMMKNGRKASNESSPSGSNTPDRQSTDFVPLKKSRSALSVADRPHSPPTGFVDQMKRNMKIVKPSDRPKAARSGAGVFGALVQNTNNLAGYAAPVNASLAPAANRPGYQLSRYSAPDVNAPQSPKQWRPPSRNSSRPGSVHSSTAVSGMGDSPRESTAMKKALSTDDMMALRETGPGTGTGTGPGTMTPGSLYTTGKNGKFRPKGMTLESFGKLPVSALKSGGTALMKGGNVVLNAEKWVMSGGKTPLRTPDMEKAGLPDYFPRPMTEDERRRKEWEKEKKRRKKAKAARKKKEVFIIQHVAAVLQRQQFLLKLARALMMFGSPSHRLETQIQATAKVLELNAQVVYLPGTMLVSFNDDATHTSETKFLKQATGLDLGKLLATHNLYWNVVHDKVSVDDASKDLDILMTTPVYYSWWQSILIGGMCGAFICVVGFNGSFIDALMTIPLGWLLCIVQIISARNDMFSNVFEIAIATIISFLAAALASTQVFCYTALVSGGVVLILPGYIVLTGALELASRNITAGAVRIGYSVIYSLFLGFGISIGAEIYHTITGLTVFGASDYKCDSTHNTGLWYQVTPSQWWYFLCCPGFAFFMSLRNQQPLFAKELPVMVIIACAGWVSNFYSAKAFPNRSDLTSAIGSFVVGTLGHIYGRFTNGSSFPVTVVGILFQLPSGLSNGGIFSFASENQSGSGNAYSDGFQVAEQLVSVAIGLTVGLFVSAAVTHPFGGGRKRGSGIFSF